MMDSKNKHIATESDSQSIEQDNPRRGRRTAICYIYTAVITRSAGIARDKLQYVEWRKLD